MQHSPLTRTNKKVLLFLIMLLLAEVFFVYFSMIFFRVNGRSMENTFKHGDVIIAFRKDVLVHFNSSADKPEFLKNRTVLYRNKGSVNLKRCVGIFGDTLIMAPDTFIVPMGMIFAAGDNFRYSVDSRENGFVDIDSIIAFPFYVVYTNHFNEMERLGRVK